jgi:chemotaxis protein CheD
VSPGGDVRPGHRKVVGISELRTSADPDDVLVTFSLGSCIGVSVWDARRKFGGLIHCMLPTATLDPKQAQEKPAMFVDSGMTLLLERLFALGAQREDLVVKIAGGASPLDAADCFRIGERNCTVLRKLLWKNSILLAAAAVGGREPRTMSLFLATGVTTIRTGGVETVLESTK